MSITLFLYFADLAGSITGALGFVVAISTVLMVAMFFAIWSEDDGDDDAKIGFIKVVKSIKFAYISCVLILVFIPSQETIYMMLGSEMVNKSNIPSKVLNLVEKKLDDYLKEAVKDKSEK